MGPSPVYQVGRSLIMLAMTVALPMLAGLWIVPSSSSGRSASTSGPSSPSLAVLAWQTTMVSGRGCTQMPILVTTPRLDCRNSPSSEGPYPPR